MSDRIILLTEGAFSTRSLYILEYSACLVLAGLYTHAATKSHDAV